MLVDRTHPRCLTLILCCECPALAFQSASYRNFIYFSVKKNRWVIGNHWKKICRNGDQERSKQELRTLFVKLAIIPTTCLPDPCACKIPLWKSSFPYNPRPIAAQQNNVVVISVHFWHAWDLDFLDFRSQHLVNRYKSRPTSAKMSIAAGMEARIPRLWNS